MMRSTVLSTAILAAAIAGPLAGVFAQQAEAPVFKTTVRRVIVDVVVTNKKGEPVPNLRREDFTVSDDGRPQQVLSFDTVGFTSAMDYVPPKMPPVPANTFVNLPQQPEKGPLYVLLYDLVNMQSESEQILARKELIKFIEEKPEGARFALFMFSDGLHLVQAFTSDKKLLLAAVDSEHSRAHVPKIFLMGKNFGQGDAPTAVWVLQKLASYLEGMPGRKNIIWFSGGFPLALYPDQDDNLQYYDEVKQTINLLARTQIAIYPVDSRGLMVENYHAPPGSAGDGALTSDAREGAPTQVNSAAGGGQGYSLLYADYQAEDQIARMTGGRAFYSNNNIATLLEHATEDGSSYYSLSYAPTEKDYDGKLHLIHVDLAKKGYNLSYRYAYYALDPSATHPAMPADAKLPVFDPLLQRKPGDTLSTYMQYGAPLMHALIFGAHVRPAGHPAMGTPAEMADLAQQTTFFRTRRKNTKSKPMPPVKLQQYTIDYTVMSHQLQREGGGAPVDLEIAAAAYDSDGNLLNATVNEAGRKDDGAQPGQPKAFRLEQTLFTPLNATTMRLAVRDSNTDRIGAMEIALPLAPEARNQALSDELKPH